MFLAPYQLTWTRSISNQDAQWSAKCRQVPCLPIDVSSHRLCEHLVPSLRLCSEESPHMFFCLPSRSFLPSQRSSWEQNHYSFLTTQLSKMKRIRNYWLVARGSTTLIFCLYIVTGEDNGWRLGVGETADRSSDSIGNTSQASQFVCTSVALWCGARLCVDPYARRPLKQTNVTSWNHQN